MGDRRLLLRDDRLIAGYLGGHFTGGTVSSGDGSSSAIGVGFEDFHRLPDDIRRGTFVRIDERGQPLRFRVALLTPVDDLFLDRDAVRYQLSSLVHRHRLTVVGVAVGPVAAANLIQYDHIAIVAAV